MLSETIEKYLIVTQRRMQEACGRFENSENNDIKNQIGAKMTKYAATGAYYSLLLSVFLKEILFFSSSSRSVENALKMIYLIRRVRTHTAVFVPQLALLYKLCEKIEALSVPGDIVECGVFNGGSSALAASVCCKESSKNRKIWLFDSFEGLPDPHSVDGEKALSYKSEGIKDFCCHGELPRVERIFKKLRIPESSVQIVKGWFQDTFSSVEIDKIALLHIDADWYESVKLCLESFYDQVQPGGFIVIDDYVHWEGCKKATDEFLKHRTPDTKLVRDGYAGCYIQRQAE